MNRVIVSFQNSNVVAAVRIGKYRRLFTLLDVLQTECERDSRIDRKTGSVPCRRGCVLFPEHLEGQCLVHLIALDWLWSRAPL